MKFLVIAKWQDRTTTSITAITRDAAFEQAAAALASGATSITIKPKTPGVKKND